MAKVAPIQTNFSKGELSPLMYGRVDYDGYANGMATCLNMVPIVQGGVTRRPATMVAAEVKDSTKATMVVRFVFSTTQAYILEFGNLYMRVYKEHGRVTSAKSVTGAVASGGLIRLTVTGHGFESLNTVDVANVDGVPAATGTWVVTVINANTIDLVGSTFAGLYTSGGTATAIVEIATPYVEADLFNLKFVQSADTLYVAHPTYAPRKITRSSHTAWAISTISFLDGPYLLTNSTAVTMTAGATSGATTMTASVATFATTDVGRLMRFKPTGGSWGWGTITAFTSSTVVSFTWSSGVSSAAATVTWRLGVWSATTGYPAAVAFFEDRLGWGGPTSYSHRGDLSNTGDYENMAPAGLDGVVAANNAVTFALTASDVQTIRWMFGDEQSLVVGTVTGEWSVRNSSQGEALSAAGVVSAKQVTTEGSANIQPLRIGSGTLFAQTALRKVYEIAPSTERTTGYQTTDLTVLSEHISLSGMKQIAYQKEPYSIVWGVRLDGVLAAMTYKKSQATTGWSRQILGGASTSGGAAVVVESVACIPAPDGTRDEAWFVGKWYINGQTKRYVVYLSKFWARGDAAEDAVFGVDLAATYDGVPVTTITGLSHLEGQTVRVAADGAVQSDKTVASAQITLDRAASVVHVGPAYNSDGQMLRNNAGAADGTAQGKTQRTHRATFRLHDTGGMKIGPDFDTLKRVSFRSSEDSTATAVPLFSGDISETWEGKYTNENYVCWRFDQIFPGTVLAIMPQQVTQDR